MIDTGCWERLKAGRAGMTEDDEMVGWHHQVNGHEFEQTPGYGEGQEEKGMTEDEMVGWHH